MASNESSNEIVGFFDVDEAKLIDSSEGQAGIVSQLIPSTSVKGLTSLESGVAQFESDVNSGLIGGLRGWSTSVVFSSSAYNSISWTSGTISLSNGIQYNVLSGSLTLTGTHYVYIDTAVSETVLQTTTNPSTPVGQTKIMVAMAIVSTDVTTKAIIKTFGGQGDSQLISALNIANGAITAAKTSIAAINPTTGEINANKVGTTQLDNGAVTGVKILNGEISAAKLNVAAINSTTGALNDGTVDRNQIVDNAINDLKISAGAVTAAKTAIAAISPTTGDLTANSVKAVNIQAGAIVAGKLDVDAVLADNIKAGAVVAGKIDTNAISADNIQAGAIVAGKLDVNAVLAGNIQAGAITTDKIYAGAVTSNKITSYNFVVSAGTFSNNTPGAGEVQWSGVKVVYEGVEYSLVNGYANNKYFYWRKASPTVMSSLNTLPDLGNDDFLILINNSGTYTLAWNSTRIDGGRITTGSITSTQIKAGTITANEIESGTITTEKLDAGNINGNVIKVATLNGDRIVAESITTNELKSNSINASVIESGTLTADKLSTSLLYAGSIQISTGGNVRSGQTDYATGTGWFLGNSGGTPKFSIGNSSKYMKWDGTSLGITGSTITSISNDTYTTCTIDGGNIGLLGAQLEVTNNLHPSGFNVYSSEFLKNLISFSPKITAGQTYAESIEMEFYSGQNLNPAFSIRPSGLSCTFGAADNGISYISGFRIEPLFADTNLGSSTRYLGIVSLRRLNFYSATTYTPFPGNKTAEGFIECSIGGVTKYIPYYQ